MVEVTNGHRVPHSTEVHDRDGPTVPDPVFDDLGPPNPSLSLTVSGVLGLGTQVPDRDGTEGPVGSSRGGPTTVCRLIRWCSDLRSRRRK